MVGHALKQIIPDAIFLSSKHFDLREKIDANKAFSIYSPKAVIHLAAKVGGLGANMSQMADFYTDNTLINTNVLARAHEHRVEKVVSLLSTCVYPADVQYPLTEEQLHLGPPHESNHGYAHAKRMLDVQSRAYRQQYGCNFITAIPNNLMGENDNFHLQDSHVIPAMIRKIYEAEQNNEPFVELWGSGKPVREFTYSGDVAKILLLLLEEYDGEQPINIGNSEEYSISFLAEKISKHIGYKGKIIWDTTKPDGQQKKPSSNEKFLSCCSWRVEDYTKLDDGLKIVCGWYKKIYPDVRGIGI